MLSRYAAVLVLLSCAQAATAQQPRLPPVDTTQVVVLQLSDGSELLGHVVAASDSSVTVVTAAGLKVDVPRRSLTDWHVRAGTMVRGRFVRSDPNTSRLYFAPTARTLRRGDGYFADYYLFFPMVGYGLLDRITVSGGMSLIPGVSFDQQAFYVAPKVGIVQSPSLAVAAGFLDVNLKAGHTGFNGGVAYGVATLGGEENSVTLGLGWPFAQGETAREPMAMVGGEFRASDRAKLLVELWKFPGTTEMPGIFGMRFFGDRLAVDFGLVHVFGASFTGFPFLPWVDFVVNW